MAEVSKYHILFYDGSDGYQANRAQIALYGTTGSTVAYIRFQRSGDGL